MKNFLLLTIVFLVGCQNIPVTANFPEAPEKLMKECEQLSTIDKETVYLSEYTKTVVENYQKFHRCSKLVESWKFWYIEQKTIFESSTKK